MSYLAHRKDFNPYVHVTPEPKKNEPAAKPGLLRRIFDALVHSRQRQAEREIARHLARSGGRLTDSLEREMMQNLTRSNWGMRL